MRGVSGGGDDVRSEMQPGAPDIRVAAATAVTGAPATRVQVGWRQ
jgi:hypothetical protein